MFGCTEHNIVFEEILLLFSGKPLKNLPGIFTGYDLQLIFYQNITSDDLDEV